MFTLILLDSLQQEMLAGSNAVLLQYIGITFRSQGSPLVSSSKMLRLSSPEQLASFSIDGMVHLLL